LPQQVALFDWVEAQTGTKPPVLDSTDVLKDPRGALTMLCGALGIEFAEEMLTWPAGRRDSDGVWASWWYNNVMRSTGFLPYREKTYRLDDELEAIAEQAAPLYSYLLGKR
jgi:hypothetical protein